MAVALMAKREIIDHPKTLSLADALDCDVCDAVGLLECLYGFVGMYATDGAVGRFGNRAIANGCKTRRDPELLVNALVSAGLLDRVDGEARLYVHDWHEHAQGWVRERLVEQGRTFFNGQEPKRSVGRPPKATVAEPKTEETQLTGDLIPTEIELQKPDNSPVNSNEIELQRAHVDPSLPSAPLSLAKLPSAPLSERKSKKEAPPVAPPAPEVSLALNGTGTGPPAKPPPRTIGRGDPTLVEPQQQAIIDAQLAEFKRRKAEREATGEAAS